MTDFIPNIRVFLCSPGDVKAEREAAYRIAKALPEKPVFQGRVAIEIVAWDMTKGGALAAGSAPQDAVNDRLGLPSECDITIALFWSRMGTPCTINGKDYLSGSHFELTEALAGKNDVYLYRRMEEPRFKSDDDRGPAQHRTLKTFFDSTDFKDAQGRLTRSVNEYTNRREFERRFEADFEAMVLRVMRRANVPTNLDRPDIPLPTKEAIAETEKRALTLAAAEQQNAAKQPRSIGKIIGRIPRTFGPDYPFHDRDTEQAKINAAIRNRTRLILVSGRGGTGKTALVSKVLGDLELDPASFDGLVIQAAGDVGSHVSLDAVISAFQKLMPDGALAVEPAMSPADKAHALLDATKSGRYILLLDNFEVFQDSETHAVTDAGLLTLLEAVLRYGGLSVLVTTRYPLQLDYSLSGALMRIPLDSGLPEAEAVAMMRGLDRLGVLPPDDAPLLELARRVNGYPRALEAAVGWRNNNATAVWDDLLNDPALFTSEVVSHVVHKAIEVLPPVLIRILEALAVFGHPVKRDALEYLLAPHLDLQAVELGAALDRLTAGRFTVFNPASRTFALHPIDLKYLESRIEVGLEGDSNTEYTQIGLATRAADWYAIQRKPQEQWEDLDDLEPQLAEFDYRLRIGDADTAADLLRQIGFDYLLRWGYAERLSNLCERLEGLVRASNLEMYRLNYLGLVYSQFGRASDSIAYCESGLTLARETQARAWEGVFLGNLGNAYIDLGRTERAIEYFEQALEIGREVKDRRGEGTRLGSLAIAYSDLGQIERGIEYYEQALAISREIKDRDGEGTRLGNLGFTYFNLGQIKQAIEYLEQALAISRGTKDRLGELISLGNLGEALATRGDFSLAIPYLSEAIKIADEIKYPNFQSGIRKQLAIAQLMMGDIHSARSTVETARRYNVSENNHGTTVLDGLALLRLNEIPAARMAFTEAVKHADKLLSQTPKYYEALYARGLAQAGLALIDGTAIDGTKDDYAAALDICVAAGIVREKVFLLDELMKCPGGERLADIRALLVSKLPPGFPLRPWEDPAAE